MLNILSKILLLSFACFMLVTAAAAQVDEQCPHIKTLTESGMIPRESSAMREQLVKLCLKEVKEEFDELVERTEQISKLADELKESYEINSAFSKEDMEKVDRIESLVKKVKKDLKASDDEEKDEAPESVLDALTMLQKQAADLLTEIRKSTRHSISLASVRSTNAVLRLIKFLSPGK